jgi:site-specific recombinase XerD
VGFLQLIACIGGAHGAVFDRFLQERRYLQNVTPRTIEWHEQSLAWLGVEQPTESDLQDFVLRMRAAGLKASSVNCRIGSVNAYLRWLGSPLRVPRLKTESYVPATYSSKQVGQIVRWRPKGFYERRLHAFTLTLLDTGVRLDEALSLTVADCNLDDLLLTVTGKGRKQRVIPFSVELRRVLAKFLLDFCPRPDSLVFSTKQGRKLSQRNVQRDIKRLCAKLGFNPPRRTVHATRHTFATEYLRRGGNLFHLQRVLGHTSLEMVRRYASIATADLATAHVGKSPLQEAWPLRSAGGLLKHSRVTALF